MEQRIYVHIDIFHAVERVSDKIPKRHLLRCECMRDWQVVFRDLSDLGEKCQCLTPTPLIMEKNLDKFWSGGKMRNMMGKKY